MTPFNIPIDHGDEQINLSIIPKKDYFNIVYADTVLGAIRRKGYDWTLLKQEEIEDEAISNIHHLMDTGVAPLSLSIHEVNLIAGKIENQIQKH